MINPIINRILEVNDKKLLSVNVHIIRTSNAVIECIKSDGKCLEHKYKFTYKSNFSMKTMIIDLCKKASIKKLIVRT